MAGSRVVVLSVAADSIDFSWINTLRSELLLWSHRCWPNAGDCHLFAPLTYKVHCHTLGQYAHTDLACRDRSAEILFCRSQDIQTHCIRRLSTEKSRIYWWRYNNNACLPVLLLPVRQTSLYRSIQTCSLSANSSKSPLGVSMLNTDPRGLLSASAGTSSLAYFPPRTTRWHQSCR